MTWNVGSKKKKLYSIRQMNLNYFWYKNKTKKKRNNYSFLYYTVTTKGRQTVVNELKNKKIKEEKYYLKKKML